MPAKISEILSGVAALLASKLTPLPVQIGYRDPRGAEVDRTFPRAGLYLYDMLPARDRKVGEHRYYRVQEGDTSVFESVKHPVPVDLFLQINLAAEKQGDIWDWSEALSVILNDSSTKVTLADGEDVFLIGETVASPEPLERVFRFKARTYFENLDDVVTVKAIIKRHIEIMGDVIEIDAPPLP